MQGGRTSYERLTYLTNVQADRALNPYIEGNLDASVKCRDAARLRTVDRPSIMTRESHTRQDVFRQV